MNRAVVHVLSVGNGEPFFISTGTLDAMWVASKNDFHKLERVLSSISKEKQAVRRRSQLRRVNYIPAINYVGRANQRANRNNVDMGLERQKQAVVSDDESDS